MPLLSLALVAGQFELGEFPGQESLTGNMNR